MLLIVVRTGFEPVRVIALPIHYDYTTTLVSVTYAIIRATICTHNNLNLPMCVDGNRLPIPPPDYLIKYTNNILGSQIIFDNLHHYLY